MRRALIVAALFGAMSSTISPTGAERILAAKPHNAGTRLISNDETARVVALTVNEALAIELPREIKDVLVGSTKVVNAVVRSQRSAYVVATGIGQTDVYFFGADGRQIGGLKVYVTTGTTFREIYNVVSVVKGTGATGGIDVLNCSPAFCLPFPATPVKPELPAGYSDITVHSAPAAPVTISPGPR
jgi:hypothetical protein